MIELLNGGARSEEVFPRGVLRSHGGSGGISSCLCCSSHLFAILFALLLPLLAINGLNVPEDEGFLSGPLSFSQTAWGLERVDRFIPGDLPLVLS